MEILQAECVCVFLDSAPQILRKIESRLMTESKGKEAIVVLAETPYYESLESAMKIRKYVKQRNVNQLQNRFRTLSVTSRKKRPSVNRRQWRIW